MNKESDIMEDIKFSSIQELYNRLKPALDTKKSELNKLGYSYIKSVDIWNALKNQKWKSATNLTLHEMVDDILNTNDKYFDDYVKKVFSKSKRVANLDEENIL